MIFTLEYQPDKAHRRLEFLERAVERIAAGYGAGNCTPESVAFWALYEVEVELGPDWVVIRAEINGEEADLSNFEIAAAVARITDKDEGTISVFGNIVGHWTTIRK